MKELGSEIAPSRWTKDAQKDFTCRKSQDEYFRLKNWWISLNTSGKNKPMKLRSDFNEPLTKLHRLHRERRATRADSFLAMPEMAGTIPGGAHENFDQKSKKSEFVKEQHKERRDPLCSFFTKLLRSDTLQNFFVVVRSFTADSSLLQPTGGVNSTPHTSHFIALACAHFNVHRHGVKFGVQRTFHSVPSSCVHDVVVLTLCDSPFYFLLSLFSPIVLFILRVFSHDVGDKYAAHSR